jgi:hypothetical protein
MPMPMQLRAGLQIQVKIDFKFDSMKILTLQMGI